jgi:hypothetical protein
MSKPLPFSRAPSALALVFSLLAAAPAAWSADVISDWSASSGSPTTPPWTKTGTSFATATGLLTIDTSSNGDNVYFLQDSSVKPGFSTLAGASIEARMRYVSGTGAAARDAGFLAITQTGHWGNALFIGDHRIFIGSGTNTVGAQYTNIDTKEFHTYRIDLGASTGSSTSTSFSVAVDGVTVLYGSTYYSTDDNGDVPVFYWGEGSSLAHGKTEWQFVRNAAPVPEPATWAMWTAGLLGAGLRLRRRRS